MRTVFTLAMILLSVLSASAQDCTVSKEFRVKHAQVLAGVLHDPNGVTLPGIGLELRSGTKVIQDLRTGKEGSFDFGQVPAGKYRLHIQSPGDPFCAPRVRCGNAGCSFDPQVRLNLKNSIKIN